MFKKRLQRDGFETVIEWDGRHLKSHREQRNRGAILDRNRELRKTDAIRKTDGVRLALDIPMADMQMLDRFFPGIANTGHPDHKWQMRRFLKSPASAPYRVTEGVKTNASHIWVK